MDVYISPDPPDDLDDWDVIEWSDDPCTRLAVHVIEWSVEDEADRQIDEMKEEGNWPWW